MTPLAYARVSLHHWSAWPPVTRGLTRLVGFVAAWWIALAIVTRLG